MRIQILFVTTFILLTLTACGNKGPVRPLEVAMPNAIQAPELRQQGSALLLGWQLPTSNQDGSPLNQPPVVDIYRMVYDASEDCPECFDRSSLLASINPQLPAPALFAGDRYLLYDRSVQAGNGYQYKLVARNSAGEQSTPMILRQTYSQPVPPPTRLTATGKDQSVVLQWQPPDLATGDELLGYLVYRRVGESGGPYPQSSQLLQEPRFEDFGLDNGIRYYYRVRAMVKRAAIQLEGLASEELGATPKSGI